MIKGKRILITGAAGSIGSELVLQLHKDNDVFGIDIDETRLFDLVEETGIKWALVNITKPYSIDFCPDIIFHAAAYKHVYPMELFPKEAIETNILGLWNTLCLFPQAKFIFISTDKAVNPDSIMGASKAFGEVLTKNRGGIVVRFGNVLGSRGSVIPIWQRQINENRALTITDPNMQRYFMTVEEACELVIEAAEKGKSGETWILDMGEPVNILSIAKEILQKSGKDLPIKVIGKRKGEKDYEEWMSAEEREKVNKKGKFYVI